ncbi:protein tyrosine phosphatase family protein [Roseomonas sp. E05]|uniref:protein tyrosine phosphatase family protein n=1 Tax=Roseomonas sp. E05 TaxID=3046310 RepID=UPI0024B9FBBA|nr:protein tyrosine phosphatase family protein [Roseomonas sp. E05]MDJ0391141.1 protein tyrosine phosphatase family protein [Roseomonas sp. E05]
MAQRIRISDGLTVDTGQPTRGELERLSQEGFRAVVNLRTAGEQNQPLPPEAEGEVARAAGLDYAHIPVAPTGPQPEQVDAFQQKLTELPGPVLVHCASGKRSGAFAILHAAREQGLSGEEALAKARALGFDWQSPELEGFVQRQLDRRA